ncbi:hypothetical protein F4814DRAFT_440793 [Daldinia grandis]|nr:hypothetical protein F4814DRAFT_440793 [Daldinia grandis]
MSEYWKSTPRYWCKHCSTYVRDTKLERQNHEATAKHQGSLKRFLRDLHRNHEQEQREKDRAKREVERLNGVVNSASSDHHHHAASTSRTSASISSQAQTQAAGSQRQQQWEQLAEMGIDVPTELRREMAMASEWTVTSEKVIDDTPKAEDDSDSKPQNVDAIASGIRKRPKHEREIDEEEEEEEKAIKSLFKKPRKWGRDTKHAPDDDAELDALLSGALVKPPKSEDSPQDSIDEKADPLSETKEDPKSDIKKEETTDNLELWSIKPEPQESHQDAPVKQEGNVESEPSTVVFKKRKPKNIRQR